MKNENMPAMPMAGIKGLPLSYKDLEYKNTQVTGFTKREQVVKDFMCALISAGGRNPEGVAAIAHKLADAYFRIL